MGCDYSTRARCEPEDVLQRYEEKSPFASVSTSSVKYHCVKYAPAGIVSEMQLKRVFSKLEINIEQPAIREWLTVFRCAGGWERNELFTAALIMSAGTRAEKSAGLFWLFAPKGSEYMEAAQGKALSAAMLKAAIEAAPKLVPVKFRKDAVFEKYRANLNHQKEYASAHLLNLLFPADSPMTGSNLMASFQGLRAGLVTLHGLRRFTESCPSELPLLRQQSEPPRPTKRLRFAEAPEERHAPSPAVETPQKSILKRTLAIA